ncbi:MAG: hypothetical protein JRI25_00870 [Deltaproteobacteria bacterium]|nr:hypothetical protein [Deltaproteobacteria bacterium]MBW2253130.1 hypothetical protein [Deltaproteobacteria bacterium]
MSCEHAKSTTLLWLYGEGDEAHLHHVAACAECQAVVAEHEAVAGLVGPIAADLAVSEAMPADPIPANRVPWRWMAVAAAVAASILVMGHLAPAPGGLDRTGDTAVAVLEAPLASPMAVDGLFTAALDADLDALDADLDWMAADLETL